jgi:lipopolysaccharide transport system ATP-binding protein
MSNVVIRAENLGKKYIISHQQEGIGSYKALRDVITDKAKVLLNPFKNQKSSNHKEEFWALKDLYFDITKGERVGIIGRNGAGKSTLLKVLSRITEPTTGKIQIKGRLASLLEVGTGFHPELTGRENIYLNGAILGMSKLEISRKFDEIVVFAEVEKFLDTPVKRYSSGMYVRLAFAVAAHLEPEILVVDEVLAVGDTQFQQKCLGKMEEVGQQGRTVFFVSHNMASIQHLCTKAMLLKGGVLVATGKPSDVIRQYLSDSQEGSSVDIRDWRDRLTSGEARLTRLEISDGSGNPTTSIPVNGTVRFTFHAEFYNSILNPCFGVLIYSGFGEPLLDIRSIHSGLEIGPIKGDIIVSAEIKNLGLYPGRYILSPWISDAGVTSDIDFVKLCCSLQMEPAAGPHGDLKLDPLWGKYWIPSKWQQHELLDKHKGDIVQSQWSLG